MININRLSEKNKEELAGLFNHILYEIENTKAGLSVPADDLYKIEKTMDAAYKRLVELYAHIDKEMPRYK